MTNYKRTIVFGAGIIFAMNIVMSLFTFLAKIIFARTLTVDEVGLFFAVFSAIGFLSLFKDFGMNRALLKFLPEYLTKKDQSKTKFMIYFIIIFSIVSSAIIGLLIFLFSDILADKYFRNPTAKIVLIILIGYLVISRLIAVISNIFLAYKRPFFSKGLMALIYLFVIFFFLVFFYHIGVNGIAWSYLFAAMLTLVIAVLLLLPLLRKIKSKYKFNKIELKKYFKFGLPLMFADLMVRPIKYFDILMITYFLPLSQVGIYSVVYYLPMILLRISSSFSTILFPVSSEIRTKGITDEFNKGVLRLYKYLLFIILPMSLVFIFFSKEIILLIYGQNYVVGTVIVQVIALGVIIHTISIINNSILNGAGKSKEVAKVVFAAGVINIVLNIILIPLLGIVGAALATLGQYIIMFILYIYYLKVYVRLFFPWRILTKMLFCGGIMSLVILITKNILHLNIYIEALIALAIAGIIYLATILIFRLLSFQEIQEIYVSLFKRKESQKSSAK